MSAAGELPAPIVPAAAALDYDALRQAVVDGSRQGWAVEGRRCGSGHPLWSAAGVLSITPHIAGDSAIGHARAAALAGEQLARWCAGEPLRNVVRAGR